MLDSLIFINESGEKLDVNLRNPDFTGLVVRSIDGLSPVKADVQISNFSLQDGGYFDFSRLQVRDVNISIGFLGPEYIKQGRDTIYRFFLPKSKISFIIDDEYFMEGYVETNEVNHFSKDTTHDIAIRCPSPFIKKMHNGETKYVINIGAYSGGFSFPFNNQLNTRQIRFSNISSNNEVFGRNEGHEASPPVINLLFTGGVKDPVLYTNNESISIITDRLPKSVSGGIRLGDRITINTRQGEKSAYLYRDGVEYNILNAIYVGDSWIRIPTGDIVIGVWAKEGSNNILGTVEFETLIRGL